MALDPEDPVGELLTRLDMFVAGQMTRAELAELRADVREALRRARPELSGEQLQVFTDALVAIDDRLLNG